MRNCFKKTTGLLVAVVVAGAFTSSAFGVASFARQTGLECLSCHTSAPGFPSLNSFGAAFKAGGYTMGQNFVEGEKLSIPAALNTSIVTKIRAKYHGGDAYGANPSLTVNTPDEYAIFFAGRVGENVGFVTEYAGGPLSFKMVFAYDVGPVKIAVVPWWSDAFSAAWAFEGLSTGAVRNIRPSESSVVSAFKEQSYGGGGEAAGLGLYVWHPMGFLVYTPFVKAYDGGLNQSAAHYVRLAVTPTLGPLETGIGFAYYTGTTSGATDFGDIATQPVTDYNAYGVDLQVIGNIGIPLSAFITYFADVEAATSDFAIYVEAGLIENTLNFGLGYNMHLHDDVNSMLIVLKYNILQNLRVSVDVTYYLDDGLGNSGYEVMPMLFGSF
ncbi:MAG: hypothetical protein ABUK01_01730 [Leptospirales bacterium]